MLERASPSAECAAHIFLRQFEAPTRSYKSLDPAFWKYGARLVDVPAWWPSYLDTVRTRSQPRICDPPTQSSSFMSHTALRPQSSRRIKSAARNITQSSLRAQTATPQAVLENVTTAAEVEQESKISLQPRNDTLGEIRSRDLNSSNVGKPKKAESLRLTRKEREQAWQDFVRAGWNSKHASFAIQKLASSNNNSDLERSLRAFSFIPRNDRTAQEYHTIVDVCIRLNRYSIAIQLIREAVSRRLNHETFFKFLALCVTKGLWNTAADLWSEIGYSEHNNLQSVTHDFDHNRKNFAGKFTFHFDIVQDMASKLTTLANRLKNNDPVLLLRKDCLIDLVKNLIVTAFESDKVMRSITSNGLLSLFSIQQEFRLEPNLHFGALATINRMPEKGLKSSLALLVYQDFKSRYPDIPAPKWVFGTLITICSAGKQPPATYRTLLEEYQSSHKNRDAEFYYQVMTACANQGEAEDVHAVFSELLKFSKPKCADDLNPLIRAHAVIGDSGKAQSEFDNVLIDYGFEHSTKNWNLLLLAYSRANNGEEAYRKFEEMQQTGVVPDSYSWSIMVAVAAKRGDTLYARRLAKRAEARGILPPLAMTGAIVDSCLLNNQTDEAWSMVIHATKASRTAGHNPVRLWNSLLRYHAFRGNSDAIMQVQQKMKDFDIKADSMTYAALMTALVVQSRTQEALQILRTLHFSQTLHANEFHYSILIHGFVMEKKAAMASVLYREMLERFPRPTPSARLSMLYLQANRAEKKAGSAYLSGQAPLRPDFRPMLDAIQETLADIKPSDLASTIPNPGFRRKSSRTDLASTYFRSLVTHLQRNNARESSATILNILNESKHSLPPQSLSTNSSWINSVEELTQNLINAMASRNWTSVTMTWDQIINIVLANCTPINDTANRSSRTISSEQAQSQNTDVENDDGIQFSDMIFKPFDAHSLQNAETNVLAAYKYVLSRPFSQYIKALGKQHKYTELLETVQKLRAYGFSLSSKNWNGVIQSLCRSPNQDDWTVAYELFERYFHTNSPSWDVIRRGRWVHPFEERPRNEWDVILKKKDRRKSRKAIEKANPGFLMPSYYTMVHLAIVWLNVSRYSNQGDDILKRRLEEGTPGTVKMVLQTPYIRDRVQGVLLRGRKVIGDRLQRPRQLQDDSGFSGVQGSQLLVDRIPQDVLVKLKSKFATNSASVTQESLHIAEELTGQVERSPIVLPSKGRIETPVEHQSRILRAEQQKIQVIRDVIDQLREDAHTPPLLVGTMKRGFPAITQQQITMFSPSSNIESTKAKDLISVPERRVSALDKDYAVRFRKQIKLSNRMRNILKKVSRSHLHQPSPLRSYKQKSFVRTSGLLRRQGIQLSPCRSEPSCLVSIPLRSHTSRRRQYIDSADEVDETDWVDIQKRDRHQRYLRRLVDYNSSSYHALKAKMTASVVVSKRSMKKLRWYMHNAQQASKELRSPKFRNIKLNLRYPTLVFEQSLNSQRSCLDPRASSTVMSSLPQSSNKKSWPASLEP